MGGRVLVVDGGRRDRGQTVEGRLYVVYITRMTESDRTLNSLRKSEGNGGLTEWPTRTQECIAVHPTKTSELQSDESFRTFRYSSRPGLRICGEEIT